MRALITGITGFAGGHLAQALLDRGDEVFGVARDLGQGLSLYETMRLWQALFESGAGAPSGS